MELCICCAGTCVTSVASSAAAPCRDCCQQLHSSLAWQHWQVGGLFTGLCKHAKDCCAGTCVTTDAQLMSDVAADASPELNCPKHQAANLAGAVYRTADRHSNPERQHEAFALCPAGMYNTIGVDAGAPSFTLSSTSLDITAFAVSLLLVFRWGGAAASSATLRLVPNTTVTPEPVLFIAPTAAMLSWQAAKLSGSMVTNACTCTPVCFLTLSCVCCAVSYHVSYHVMPRLLNSTGLTAAMPVGRKH